MDIALAGEMDGIAAADHIQSFSDVPIVYLTGHSRDPLLKQARVTAPYGYLVKPVSRQELAATIEMALYRHALNVKLKERMEMDVRRAAAEWRATFDSIADLVTVLDRHARIVRANAAATSFFGLPPDRILGSRCCALMHGTEEPVARCPWVKTMQSRRHEETELYDEARHVWFRISTDPIFNDEGEIVLIVHSARDITEQKRLETEAFAARRELLRFERLLRMGNSRHRWLTS